jgi:hypothetical protein
VKLTFVSDSRPSGSHGRRDNPFQIAHAHTRFSYTSQMSRVPAAARATPPLRSPSRRARRVLKPDGSVAGTATDGATDDVQPAASNNTNNANKRKQKREREQKTPAVAGVRVRRAVVVRALIEPAPAARGHGAGLKAVTRKRRKSKGESSLLLSSHCTVLPHHQSATSSPSTSCCRARLLRAVIALRRGAADCSGCLEPVRVLPVMSAWHKLTRARTTFISRS